MSIDDQVVKFEELRKQLDKNSMLRIRLEEQLRAATMNLRRIMEEVRAAGYDPRTLEEEKVKKAQELSDAIDKLADQVAAQTDAISAIEVDV